MAQKRCRYASHVAHFADDYAPSGPVPTVSVEAVSMGESALREALRYPPPMIELASHRGNFSFWWKLIQFVYDLPDPTRFPALGPFSVRESEILSRYVHVCEQLATSRLINYPVSWKLVLGGPEDDASTIDRPDDEAMRGVLAAFRQAHTSSETACFRVVKNIVSARASKCGDAGAIAQTRAWAKAQRGLFEAPLPRIVETVVLARHTHRGREPVGLPASDTPEAILETFMYGDFLHYGKKAANAHGFRTRPRPK